MRVCYTDRPIVGLIEKVTVIGNEDKRKRIDARIDSGAEKSSLDLKLAKELRLGPVIHEKVIRSAHGKMKRPVMEATIILENKEITTHFTLADRTHMRYKVLVGQNILKQGFLIDCMKKRK